MTANENKSDATQVLWTGGWDSTYRIVELSRKDTTIEPIYVYGDNRKSEKNEIEAINTIIEKLKKKEETEAEILPIHFIDRKSIPSNDEITQAYNTIIEDIELGGQYEWLARLATEYPGMELGIELAPESVSGAIRGVHKYGHLVYNETNDAYVLDKEKSTPEGFLVFGQFNFPIIKMDGQEMKENITRWGYEDVMKHVWVCHTPYLGKPCGLCNPCKLKIETGMELLMTPAAMKRYKNRNKTPHKYFLKLERKFYLTLNDMRNKS